MLSAYQEAAVDWAVNGEGNGALIAKAGSGKTFTIVEVIKKLPSWMRVLYLAFNKHNQVEAAAKVPGHCQVKTCHSFGMGAIYYDSYRTGGGKKPVMDEKKLETVVAMVLPDQYLYAWKIATSRLIKLAKNYLTDDHQKIRDLAFHHGVEIPFHYGDEDLWEDLLEAVTDGLELCASRREVFDFDDMVWLPVVNRYATKRFDMVIVDEAQDLNNCQIELVNSALGRDGRLLVVGDPNQAIYGFRGSDHRVFSKLVQRFDCRTLPLSITYRCPTSVTAEAQRLVPDIEAAPDAEEGEVRDMLHEDFLMELAGIYGDNGTREGGRDDLVLCRTMAPLIPPCFTLIRDGVKAQIRGRDIGKNLVSLVNKQKAKTLAQLADKLRAYEERMAQKYMELDQAHLTQRVRDKVDTILAVAEYVDSVTELVARIRSIFSEDLTGVTFSTIHRAKGCEATHVWLMHPELLPHPMARKKWEQEQERNLEYVAITRAKHTLTYVRGS